MGRKNVRLVLGVVTASLAFSFAAFGYDVDLDYKNTTQIRKDRFSGLEAPVNQYFSLGVTELPKNVSFQTNFGTFANTSKDELSFDLYQAAFHVEPTETFYVDAGRQWFADGFDPLLVDGVKLGCFPSEGFIGGSLYAGLPRYLEDSDFLAVTEGLVVGANLNLQNVKDTTGQLSFKWRKIDATVNDYEQNDTVFAGIASSHSFSNLKFTPNVFENFEYDLFGSTINVLGGGVSFYPHWRLAATFEGNYFNINRDSTEVSILKSFANTGIGQGRFALEFKIFKNLSFINDFAFERYGVAGRGDENGYITSAGLDGYFEAIKLSSLGKYYYKDSYGGTVHGGLIDLSNKYFDKIETALTFDVSRYSKITNQEKLSFSVVGDVWYSFTKNCRLALGGEFNRNDWFDNEGRLTVNFELGLDNKSYTPEKRSKKVNRKFNQM